VTVGIPLLFPTPSLKVHFVEDLSEIKTIAVEYKPDSLVTVNEYCQQLIL
jgi:hypothetical protein